MTVRPAIAGDIERIGNLAQAGGLFPAEMTDAIIAPFFGEGSDDLWVVATRDDQVEGFLYAAPERFTDGTYNLLAMAVTPDLKGTGIGTAMMSDIEARLAKRGVRIILVETSSQPQFEPTKAFYLARHFDEEARIRDYWAAGDDKLIFRKVLP